MVKNYEPPKHPYRFCQCEEEAFESKYIFKELENSVTEPMR